MKRTLVCMFAALLLLSTLFLVGCKKDKEIDYDRFIQSVHASEVGETAYVNGEKRVGNYVQVFVNVKNETDDPVTVRKGDYTLVVGGERYVSDGYMVMISGQSGTNGQVNLDTVTYETIGKGDEKRLAVIFLCDVEDNSNFTLLFHDRVVPQSK